MSLLGVACGQPDAPSDTDADALSDKVDPRIRVEVGANVSKDLLVMLAEPAGEAHAGVQGAVQALALDLDETPADDARELTAELVDERAELYAELQARVLTAVSGNAALELKVQYQNIPFLLVNVRTLAGLEALAARPEVARIYEDTVFEHQLAQSLPLIKQTEVAAAGNLGANTAVAVLDTGCDYTRAAFGSCSAPGAPGCKVAYARDFATNDNSRDDNGHGTNVSGIVLGVAPSTKIVALDVFNGAGAPGSAILQAIDWTISNRTTYNIVAMNMSLGGSGYAAPCSSDYFASAVANARSAGILAAIASGNNGFTASISTPACVPAAISVGAVYDANVGGMYYSGCSDATTASDKVTCFSNSASFLSVLAPGAPVTAAGITMTGTSQATPHVAGAIAVIRAAFPNESIAATVARITDTGKPITDARSNVTKRRLDLQAALGAASVDTTPPTGRVDIESGAAATNKANVTLTIAGSDTVGVAQMCVSNTTSCTAFSAFTTTKSWTLASGDGVKTVYVSLRDAAGNIAQISDTIVRDATPPGNPVVTVAAGDGLVDLSWTAASDAASGVYGYKVVYAINAAPASCDAGTVAYSGVARTASHTHAVNGTLYFYRVCAIDAAGNSGAGATVSARPAPERNAPLGTVVIQGGATYAKSAAVTLTIAANDANGVTGMCISNVSTSCTSYIPYTTVKTWSLTSAGNVYVWFRDGWFNSSTTPATDSIIVDSTAPKLAGFTAAPSSGRVALSWPSATDEQSGIVSYKVVWAKSTAAPTCTAGNVAYSGTGNAYAHEGLTAGKYSFRLCATDRAGNTTTGLTRTVTVPN